MGGLSLLIGEYEQLIAHVSLSFQAAVFFLLAWQVNAPKAVGVVVGEEG